MSFVMSFIINLNEEKSRTWILSNNRMIFFVLEVTFALFDRIVRDFHLNRFVLFSNIDWIHMHWHKFEMYLLKSLDDSFLWWEKSVFQLLNDANERPIRRSEWKFSFYSKLIQLTPWINVSSVELESFSGNLIDSQVEEKEKRTKIFKN